MGGSSNSLVMASSFKFLAMVSCYRCRRPRLLEGWSTLASRSQSNARWLIFRPTWCSVPPGALAGRELLEWLVLIWVFFV